MERNTINSPGRAVFVWLVVPLILGVAALTWGVMEIGNRAGSPSEAPVVVEEEADEPPEEEGSARVCDDPEACYERALRWMETPEGTGESLEEVIELLEGACRGGLAVACQDRAVLAEEGVGERDEAVAARFFSKACELGHEPGCVGARQADPTLRQDPESWERRCGEGELQDCVQFGLFREAGGEFPGVGEATEYFQRACEGGLADGCFWWARYLEGRGMEGDERQRELYLEACEGGMARACTTLARRLDADGGEGLMAVLVRACELGDGYGCHHLGIVERRQGNAQAARESWERGCDLWHADSCNALAMLLVEQEPEAAAPRYERACQLGVEGACFNFAVYLNVHEGPEAFERSRRLLLRACDQSHAQACFFASRMVEGGQGGPAEPGRAEELRRRACELGLAAAC